MKVLVGIGIVILLLMILIIAIPVLVSPSDRGGAEPQGPTPGYSPDGLAAHRRPGRRVCGSG
ncbi:MAG TPA: hypothetical protein DCQ94_20535 [Nitrospira sp.]|nr:hypothetical protein [Nitrospira sp.]